ncbi:MAG TPA: carboxylesterase [Solimonas sp.]|nr:carboxylesterase [Solimonas sp.]
MKIHETSEAVTLEPATAADACVIWLHGLGADGHDFVPLVPELGLPKDHAIRFIFPHAPVRPVTLNGGMPMRAWYDIPSLSLGGRQDEAGIRASEARITGLIAEQVAGGIKEQRIVIAGFSQGGAITLHMGVRHPRRLAGLIALSTYMPLHELVQGEAHPANRDLPVFMAHGRFDNIVPHDWGKTSAQGLQALGYPVEWHDYPMQHQVCEEEIEQLGRWLTQRLA